jgi:hypothetical protein
MDDAITDEKVYIYIVDVHKIAWFGSIYKSLSFRIKKLT